MNINIAMITAALAASPAFAAEVTNAPDLTKGRTNAVSRDSGLARDPRLAPIADPQPANMGAPPSAGAAATPAAPAAPAPAGSVARAQFTSEVRDREPADLLTSLPNTDTRIYFFTELKGLAGQTVMHRWEHNGKVMAEVPIEVGGERWRTFTSKTLDPSLTGEWKASVIDAGGSTLSASTFTYNTPAAGPASAPASPAATTR